MQQPDWIIQLQDQDDDRYTTILLALRSVNAAFRLLYRSGCWLPAHVAKTVGDNGLLALQAYQKLAERSLSWGEPRYPLYPKYHMLLHQFFKLIWDSQTLEWVESPMVDCCQQCEGFVGEVSRMSRRVSPKATISRALDVYFIALWKQWENVE